MQSKFSLNYPGGPVISSSLTPGELAVIPGVKERDMYNGWTWYDLPETEIQGKRAIIRLAFYKEQLSRIDVSLTDPSRYGSTWENWSESGERLRAEDTAQWLASLGYGPGEYVWGDVWRGYDSKGGQGYARICFR